MASDSELIDRLREFLRVSDLNTTTTAIVRRKLEEDFGVDLSDRKAFIRQQVDLFLQTEENKEETEEEEEEVDEEEKKPKVKSEANNGSDLEEEEVSEEEEDSEEEGSSSNGKGRKKNKKKKQVSNSKNKDVKKGGGGFAKVCSLSPELQKFVGVPEMARTEVVRHLWAYIKEKELQDPDNRKDIRCDEALRTLFGVDVINMFQMNKALSRHIWPLESEGPGPATSTPKEKKPKPKPKSKRERGEDSDGPEKRRKGSASGFLAPLPLSDALIKFIGTGENVLPRSAVVKKIWDYIKENKLQDPVEKTKVICDDKLKELFEVDSFVGFTVPKLLKNHFIKAVQ